MPPLSIDVRITENTGRVDVGEGVLWRSKVEPTSFKILVADPVTGQVVFQGRRFRRASGHAYETR